ncbi:MAG: histidine kinase [Candidatus Electrothrix sp. ATG1]|nr:histidine kinase [Candidatus Electrothrix sp. ATG1]
MNEGRADPDNAEHWVQVMSDKSHFESVIENGENTFTEFKDVSVSPTSLAEELVAFLNSKGGSIYLGVADNGDISGIDFSRKGNLEETVMNVCRNNVVPPVIPDYELIHIDGKWIARVTVDEGISKPYSTVQGKHFVRTGSTKRIASRDELFRLHQNALVLHIDDHPIQGARPEVLDMDKAQRFFEKVYDIVLAESDDAERENILINSCILVRIDTGLFVSVTGLLFFAGKSQGIMSPIERYLPQAGIQFVNYKDEDLEVIIDRYDAYEPCPECIDTIVHKIRLNWKMPSEIDGLQRVEIAFPEKIFRELIVNAVAHRDYSLQTKIQVRMFPDRVEVVTPGRLINSLTVEKMKHGVSILRNPLIMKYMQNYRYSDQLGRGIPMVLRKLKDLPGVILDLQEKDDFFFTVLQWKVDE